MVREFTKVIGHLNQVISGVLSPVDIQKRENAYLENIYSSEKFPQGIHMSFSRFLQLAQCHDFGSDSPFARYKIAELYQYLPALFPSLEQAQFSLFESSIADAIQIALTGISLGGFTAHYIPFVHANEITKIETTCESILHPKKTFSPITALQRFGMEALDDIKFHPPGYKHPSGLPSRQDYLEMSKQVNDRYLFGPDIDGRIKVAPGELFNWLEQTAHSVANTFKIPTHELYILDQMDLNNTWTMRFSPKGYIRGNNPKIAGIGEMNAIHTPVFEFSYGIWESGIPFCNIRLGGLRYGQIQDDQSIIPFVDIGLASDQSLLPKELQNIDTRTAPHTVHSLNSLKGTLETSQKAKIGPHIPQDLDIPHNQWHKLVELKTGIFTPAVNGEWNDEGIYKTYPYQWDSILRSDELWMNISPHTMRQYEAPLKFGKNYGKMHPDVTFLEGLRTFRYALRYMRDLSLEEPNNIHALQLFSGKKLQESIQRQMQELGAVTSSLNVDTVREITTCLFFSPQEFIRLGKIWGLDHYLPRWNMLQLTEDLLPPQTTIINTLTNNQNRVFYGVDQTGITLVANALRKKFPKDIHIQKKGDLELVHWIASLL